MALALADRLKAYSAVTAIELREKTLAYNLFDRSWESDWVAGAHSVQVGIPDWDDATDGVTPTTRARGGNWAAAKKIDADTVDLLRSGGYSVSNNIDYEDVLEIPWATVERMRSRQVYKMRKDIDDAIFDVALAATPTGAANLITGGASGATFVSRTAPYAATVAGEPGASGTGGHRAVRALRLQAERHRRRSVADQRGQHPVYDHSPGARRVAHAGDAGQGAALRRAVGGSAQGEPRQLPGPGCPGDAERRSHLLLEQAGCPDRDGQLGVLRGDTAGRGRGHPPACRAVLPARAEPGVGQSGVPAQAGRRLRGRRGRRGLPPRRGNPRGLGRPC